MENTLAPVPETEPTAYRNKILSLTPCAAPMVATVSLPKGNGHVEKMKVMCFALVLVYGDEHDPDSAYEEVQPVFFFPDGEMQTLQMAYNWKAKILFLDFGEF